MRALCLLPWLVLAHTLLASGAAADGPVLVAVRAAHAPALERVVAAALRAFDRQGPAPVRELRSRGRLRGWVPTLELRARRGQGRDHSFTWLEESGRVVVDDTVSVEVALRFELDRLVYGVDEIALLRLETAAHEAREERRERVAELFLEWAALEQVRTLGAAWDGAQAARHAELTGWLDLFTGGAFRRMISRAR